MKFDLPSASATRIARVLIACSFAWSAGLRAQNVAADGITVGFSAEGRAWELRLDVAMRRDAAGEHVVALSRSATLADHAARLAAAGGGDATWFPLCLPLGVDRPWDERRLLTERLVLWLEPGAPEPSLPDGLRVVERPAYAPLARVIAAADPRAALAAARELSARPGVALAEPLLARRREPRSLPDDPLFAQQWNFHSGSAEGLCLRLPAAWRLAGPLPRLGEGVRIGIVDDGLQLDHPDLAPNIDLSLGYDWVDGDSDPSPVRFGDIHGTACAGLAAARGGNGIGISSAAPRAKLVGMRLLSFAYDDAKEAAAMAHREDAIEILSNSWGPNDSGRVLDGPGPLTRAAIAHAAEQGRQGRGRIFVWAAGNGGANEDQGNKDGYANSIHTIAVNGIDSLGRIPDFAEPGPHVLVSAPTTGGGASLPIVTTDRSGGLGYAAGDYHSGFDGSSPAAPQIAGVVALMLGERPDLGWRDVQEILVRSARQVAPEDPGWRTNRAGIPFHSKLGAGLADAAAALELAENWTLLPPAESRSFPASGLPGLIADQDPGGLLVHFEAPADLHLRVEQVTLRTDLRHSARGNLRIELTSPGGTTSRLVDVHPDTGDDYRDWTFSSVHHWGEGAAGRWTLRVSDLSALGNLEGGTLESALLGLHGSAGTFSSWLASRPAGETPADGALPPLAAYHVGGQRDHAPRLSLGENGAAVFRYRRWLAAGDTSGTSEWSPDLSEGAWTSEGLEIQALPDGDDFEWVEARAPGGRGFLRLRVTLQPGS